MDIINNFLVSRLDTRGITLVEVIGVVVILGILMAIAVPSVMGIIEGAKEDVCEVNRVELEKAFETDIQLRDVDYSDSLFGNFVINYGEEICPDGGDVYYADGEVECSVHRDSSDEGNEGEDVPYL